MGSMEMVLLRILEAEQRTPVIQSGPRQARSCEVHLRVPGHLRSQADQADSLTDKMDDHLLELAGRRHRRGEPQLRPKGALEFDMQQGRGRGLVLGRYVSCLWCSVWHGSVRR